MESETDLYRNTWGAQLYFKIGYTFFNLLLHLFV